MTKAELIGAIAGEAGITKAAAGKALDAFMGAVAKELKKSGKLGLVASHVFRDQAESPRGKEPADRQSHQDSREEGREIQGRQGSGRQGKITFHPSRITEWNPRESLLPGFFYFPRDSHQHPKRTCWKRGQDRTPAVALTVPRHICYRRQPFKNCRGFDVIKNGS